MQTNFFKDKHGRIVIWQWPNIPLWGWIIFAGFGMAFHQTHLSALGAAFLFVWAYEEVVSGDSRFRQVLGAGVMIGLITSILR